MGAGELEVWEASPRVGRPFIGLGWGGEAARGCEWPAVVRIDSFPIYGAGYQGDEEGGAPVDGEEMEGRRCGTISRAAEVAKGVQGWRCAAMKMVVVALVGLARPVGQNVVGLAQHGEKEERVGLHLVSAKIEGKNRNLVLKFSEAEMNRFK
jgi:hypothetical protein